MTMMPDTYRLTPEGRCGHCGNGRWQTLSGSAVGVFCCACCRWAVYVGPPRVWGDGMGRDHTIDPRHWTEFLATLKGRF